MVARRVSLVSWVICVLAVVGCLPFLVMGIGRTTPGDDFVIGGWGGLAFAVAALAFGTVGALVTHRLPDNRVGWVFCLIGTSLAAGDFCYQYADQAGSRTGLDLPAGALAAWAQNLTIPPCFGLIALALLLFPDGHLPSRRWWPAPLVALSGSLFVVVGYAFRPGPLDAPFGAVDNPVGVPGGFGPFETISAVGWPLMGCGLLLAAAAMRRRSKVVTGLERQQLKWVNFAAAIAGVLIVSDVVSFFAVDDSTDLNAPRVVALGIGFAVIPIAAGVAILRYRLYDIDVVINRTLVYGSLTATLATVYIGTVLLLQLALSGLTQGSGLAVAASTLGVAALFGPARARIQASVDRRFFRSRYDATRTIQSFSARLRDEVDLDSLCADLQVVVAQTMQPAHLSLWLRDAEGARP